MCVRALSFIKPSHPFVYGRSLGTSLVSNTVCWGPGSNIVTAGCGCDSVDPIFNYVDTHKLCTLLSNLAKICA